MNLNKDELTQLIQLVKREQDQFSEENEQEFWTNLYLKLRATYHQLTA